MGPTVVVRSSASRALGAVMVAIAGLVLLAVATDGADAVVTWGPLVVLFGVLGWAAFWQPYVEVSDGGVRVVNTLRTVLVPWPAVDEVEGRYGLTLRTAWGTVQAWGAQAPSGRGRAGGREGEAAQVVRERWERLRDAGHLDGGRLEQQRLPVTWHRGTVAALVVLPLLAALTLALG
ncbi:PH domain-containing protein [Nocardioides marmoraquaticus]